MRHSGEHPLCHITVGWEWVKQGADREGSVGILTWAKGIGMSSQAEKNGSPCLWAGVEVDSQSPAISFTGKTCTCWLSLQIPSIYRHLRRSSPTTADVHVPVCTQIKGTVRILCVCSAHTRTDSQPAISTYIKYVCTDANSRTTPMHVARELTARRD